MWSLNLLLLAENAHMALAMWQTGMNDEAYRIFKGALLDSMYMGLCPGDFHMTSTLDVHRQEAQRDFGDPIGISSRALVEGLFGIQPDLIANIIKVRPGFPSNWNNASLKHKDLDFAWHREGLHETYEFTSRLPKPVPIVLSLPARTTSLPVVMNGAAPVPCAFDPIAVGSPILTVKLPAAGSYRLSLQWHGRAPSAIPAQRSYNLGADLELPAGVTPAQVEDPQKSLDNGRIAAAGFHTVFANIHEADCAWSIPISFSGNGDSSPFAIMPHLAAPGTPVDLSPVLKHNITEIFTRVYAEPRSPYCSLAFPDNLLGGWANADNHATIDDAGLRAAKGTLTTGMGVTFSTPSGVRAQLPLPLPLEAGRERSASSPSPAAPAASTSSSPAATLPQCSRMTHATVSVTYSDGSPPRPSPCATPRTGGPSSRTTSSTTTSSSTTPHSPRASTSAPARPASSTPSPSTARAAPSPAAQPPSSSPARPDQRPRLAADRSRVVWNRHGPDGRNPRTAPPARVAPRPTR
jgi:hypothetical protein